MISPVKAQQYIILFSTYMFRCHSLSTTCYTSESRNNFVNIRIRRNNGGVELHSNDSQRLLKYFIVFDTHPLKCQYKNDPLKRHIYLRKSRPEIRETTHSHWPPSKEKPTLLLILPFNILTLLVRGTRWRSWLTQCATSRKVVGSILSGVTGILH
jgi:hypothetical protein